MLDNNDATILNIQTRIIECLNGYQWGLNEISCGPMNGPSGIVLLNALLYERLQKKKLLNKVHSDLDVITSFIEKDVNVLSSFCGGLAGFGWLMNLLINKRIVDLEPDEYFEDLDAMLESELDRMLLQNEMDLLHGALGIGLYFLKRGNRRAVEKVVKSLCTTAIHVDGQIAWKRFDFYSARQDIFDFGLAHGITGILYFLGKCLSAGIFESECIKMMDGALSFLFHNIQNEKSAGSFFPPSITVADYFDKKEPSLSRMSWCYGDLGMLHTFLLVATWKNDKVLRETTIQMLNELAYRSESAQGRLTDACFCHGGAGNAMIFNNLYNITGEYRFKEAYDFWINNTLAWKRFDDNINCGYLFSGGEKGYLPKKDLLNGLAGIGLAFSVDQYQIADDWAELFFLA